MNESRRFDVSNNKPDKTRGLNRKRAAVMSRVRHTSGGMRSSCSGGEHEHNSGGREIST